MQFHMFKHVSKTLLRLQAEEAIVHNGPNQF